VILFLFNTALIWLPGNNPVSQFFNVVPFVDDNGKEYYSYKAWLYFAIFVDAVLTFSAEIIIVRFVT
jgi:hypothetical protein